jgi:hypothetical protein
VSFFRASSKCLLFPLAPPRGKEKQEGKKFHPLGGGKNQGNPLIADSLSFLPSTTTSISIIATLSASSPLLLLLLSYYHPPPSLLATPNSPPDSRPPPSVPPSSRFIASPLSVVINSSSPTLPPPPPTTTTTATPFYLLLSSLQFLLYLEAFFSEFIPDRAGATPGNNTPSWSSAHPHRRRRENFITKESHFLHLFAFARGWFLSSRRLA